MESTMNALLLPEVIMLEIFRYLPYSDLCKAAQVCTLWRSLSQDGSLHKVIDVRDKSLTPESIEEFIVHKCSEELVDLKLRLVEEPESEDFVNEPGYEPISMPCTNITLDCLKLLGNRAPNLRFLTLEKSVQIVNSEDRVAFIASLPKSITHLSVAGSIFNEEYESDVFNHDCSNVACLNLSNCYFGKNPVELFPDVPNLKALYLEEVFFYKRGTGVKFFLPALPQLKILDLESPQMRLHDDEIDLVFENCVALEELYLGNSEAVTNEMMHRIRGGQLPMLHTLCAINTSVTPDMEHFLRLKLKNLKYFSCAKQETPCHHYQSHKCPM